VNKVDESLLRIIVVYLNIDINNKISQLLNILLTED